MKGHYILEVVTIRSDIKNVKIEHFDDYAKFMRARDERIKELRWHGQVREEAKVILTAEKLAVQTLLF